MGQKLNPQMIAGYAKQLSGVNPETREPLESYFERISETLPDSRFPYTCFFPILERCSFIESVLLNKKRSLIYQNLEQQVNTMIVGLEQSPSFSGKQSLFCAWTAYDFSELSDQLERLNGLKTSGSGKLPIALGGQSDGSVFAVAPFSAFVIPRAE